MKDFLEIRRRDGVVYKARLDILDDGDLNNVVKLQQEVVAQIKDVDLFYVDDRDFLSNHVQKRGRILGVKTEGDCLIAYSVLAFPGVDPDNLGYDLQLPERELPYVSHFDSVVVHPSFRGNSLQYVMQKYLIRIAKENNMRLIASTVSPENTYSLRNLQRSGFKIVDTKEKYAGMIRHLLVLKLD